MPQTRLCFTGDEEGAAVIEMLFVIPIIVVFAAAILDFSMLIKCNIALDSAATAAVRYCMDSSESPRSEEEVRAYLKVVDPSLADVEIHLTEEPVQRVTYNHLFYVDETERIIPRKSYCSMQPFTVELTYKSRFKTLIGQGVSLASGSDGSLTVVNKKAGTLDRTDGDTW